ncbi:hypothetical protein [Spirillospora sp. NBC_01491]|uniref:hypothetical protein n=1 Tax=Spirillospora sp. NBC_01491 TaxID=2976007 RepID=UPI002E3646F3|nr:hypothetical protein [Spirillospora sp. NBC_01491]
MDQPAETSRSGEDGPPPSPRVPEAETTTGDSGTVGAESTAGTSSVGAEETIPDGTAIVDDLAEETMPDSIGAGVPAPQEEDDPAPSEDEDDDEVEDDEEVDDAVGPPSIPDADDDGAAALRERVEAVYGPLTEVYERLNEQLREASESEDVPAVGWTAHVSALRSFRAEDVYGEWEDLARLLVDPESLEGAAGTRVRLLGVPEDGSESAMVREVVERLLAGGERALLLAPTAERAETLLRDVVDDDAGIFPLIVEALAVPGHGPSERTAALPPVEPEDAGESETTALPFVEAETEALPEIGSNGTVEFKSLKPPTEPAEAEVEVEVETRPDSASVMTRPETLPEIADDDEDTREDVDDAPRVHEPPEAWTRGASVRPVGEAWRRAWQTEGRLLQRGLLWLEQWPRDVAALEGFREAHARRREELDAEIAALEARIEGLKGTVIESEQAAAGAEAESERLAEELAEAAAELAGPLAEAERLQAIADAAAAEAGELTRSADTAHARVVDLDERGTRGHAERQAAQQLEQSLTADLARAREELPAAAEEAERLAAADSDASAEGHTSYYRLVTAESALAARRRKMSLGQRLHVAPSPADLKDLRAEVRARTREADEAAGRAKVAKEAAQAARGTHAGITAFINEGGARMDAARETQRRLGEELVRLAAERESAAAEHQGQARKAAEAVDHATETGLEARVAQQAARAIEERLAAVRAAREEALVEAERERAEAGAASAQMAEARTELERRRTGSAEELAARSAELETLQEAESRSRDNVREICGTDPAGEPGLLTTHQERAMTRIEQLTGYLEAAETGHEAGDSTGEVLLRAADLVVGTPVGIGAARPPAEFDVLIVAGAGEITDAGFLIGAVRARGWVLIGARGPVPPAYPEHAEVLAAFDPGDEAAARVAGSPFGRTAEAAPGLIR